MLYLKLCDRAIGSILDNRLEDVDTTRGEPLVTPFPKIEISTEGLVAELLVSIIESTDEILQLCVLPGMFREVHGESLHHDLSAKHIVELL